MRAWSPTRTLSSTLMRPNRATFWKVRAMPRRMTWCGRKRSSSWPSKRMAPAEGWYRRLMQLKRLVLPAPFGPISPTIWLAAMSNETWSSAATPPKRMLRSAMERSGAPLEVTAGQSPVPLGGTVRPPAERQRGASSAAQRRPGDVRPPPSRWTTKSHSATTRRTSRVGLGSPAMTTTRVPSGELDLPADVDRLADRLVVVDAGVVLGHELLGDGVVIGRGVLDRDARVHERIFGLVQVVHRIQHRLAGELRPRLLEDVDQSPCRGHAVDVEPVLQFAVRVVLAHDLLVLLDARIVRLARIGRILQVLYAQDAVDRSVITSRFLRRLDVRHRRGHRVQVDRRMPARLRR